MHIQSLLSLLSLTTLPLLAHSKLVLDYQASRNDDPKTLGLLNLEKARGEKVKEHTDDLFIRASEDMDGNPAAHFHRKKDYIRAEYHALKDQMEADKTYNITYEFAVHNTAEKLQIWQFKEYSANNDEDGGAEIPLALEFQSETELELQYQADRESQRERQWARDIEKDKKYSVSMIINTSSPGWLQFYFDGELQEIGEKGKETTKLEAVTFPSKTDPKFGAYRGEKVEIDTFVYLVQIDVE